MKVGDKVEVLYGCKDYARGVVLTTNAEQTRVLIQKIILVSGGTLAPQGRLEKNFPTEYCTVLPPSNQQQKVLAKLGEVLDASAFVAGGKR